MVRRYRKKPSLHTDIAKERIVTLFNKAGKAFGRDNALADRYVTLARKISMKFKVRIPSGMKRQFCPHCYRFLRPGANLRVRLTKTKVVYSCLECKKFWRMPYLKEKKARQKSSSLTSKPVELRSKGL